MWIFKKAKALLNLGLRASTLVFRFGLSFYIVKFLGLDATGLYGLALGVIAIVPAAIGWGLNYFVARDIVGQAPLYAGARVKTRLCLTMFSLFAVSLIGLVAIAIAGVQLSYIHLLILALMWLETFALDIHIPLIAQEMALEANFVVFIRSALWIPIFVGVSWLFPTLRSIEWVFSFWIMSYVPTVMALIYSLRRWPLVKIARSPLEIDWISSRLRRSWLIYLSDISIVGLMYADRYIVNFILGLALTGVYSFFWSLTNALQTLVSTAVVQLALPVIFKAYNTGSAVEWARAVRQELMKTAGTSVALGAGVFVGAEILLYGMNMQELGGHLMLFILMLAAAVVRSCSDLLNIGLTSMKKDRHYAMTNLVGVVLAMSLAYIMITLFGLIGAGIAAFLSATIIATIRAVFLIHFGRVFANSSRDREL